MTISPFQGPCKALTYKWSWSTEANGCVLFRHGGCIGPGIDIDNENIFEVRLILLYSIRRDKKNKFQYYKNKYLLIK